MWVGLVNALYSFLFIMALTVLAAPKAFVHIGPHKTSSSHIQNFITRTSKILEKENLYWPRKLNGTIFNHKEVAFYAAALRNNSNDPFSTITTIEHFLQKSLANNHNVILSSEEFDNGMGDGLRQLKEMLRGFEVTIVYVYRELLSHMVSVYFELNRFEHDIRATEPFSTYLLKNLDYINPVLEPMPLLRDYSAVFGHDNIAVIDLYGCPTDVTYVLICELAGAMCHRPDLFVYNKHINANAKYSLVHSEVFSAFNAYVESQRGGQCKFCRPLRDAFKVFDATLRARLAQRGAPTLPLIRSGLGMLVPNAEKIDATLRTQYGDRILHGNPAASLKAMKRRVHVESLDLATFLSSKEWAAWMRHSFAMAMSQGQICGCK